MISQGQFDSFMQVARSLIHIRDNELWAEHGCTSFEQYCWARWECDPDQVAQILAMVEGPLS